MFELNQLYQKLNQSLNLSMNLSENENLILIDHKSSSDLNLDLNIKISYLENVFHLNFYGKSSNQKMYTTRRTIDEVVSLIYLQLSKMYQIEKLYNELPFGC